MRKTPGPPVNSALDFFDQVPVYHKFLFWSLRLHVDHLFRLEYRTEARTHYRCRSAAPITCPSKQRSLCRFFARLHCVRHKRPRPEPFARDGWFWRCRLNEGLSSPSKMQRVSSQSLVSTKIASLAKEQENVCSVIESSSHQLEIKIMQMENCFFAFLKD